MFRRVFARILAAAAVLALTIASASLAADGPALPHYPEVRPGVAMSFPADHGAHPQFRAEWWYITGWLDTGEGKALGFQVTFFRTRPSVDENNPSAFSAKQILFAHAALSDPSVGHLLHDQRAARAGFGLAQAAEGDTDVVLDDWSLKRGADDVFRAKLGGKEFTRTWLRRLQPVLSKRERLQPQKTARCKRATITACRICGFRAPSSAAAGACR
jgi:predicted secreted hydrolase